MAEVTDLLKKIYPSMYLDKPKTQEVTVTLTADELCLLHACIGIYAFMENGGGSYRYKCTNHIGGCDAGR